MKQLSSIVLLSLMAFGSKAQVTGSIRQGTTSTLEILIKNETLTTFGGVAGTALPAINTTGGFLFAIRFPTQGAAPSASASMKPGFASTSLAIQGPVISGGFTYFFFSYTSGGGISSNPAFGGSAPHDFAPNEEVAIANVNLSGFSSLSGVQLVDIDPGGGPGSNAYWYVDIGGIERSAGTGALSVNEFFQSASTNPPQNVGSGESTVSLSAPLNVDLLSFSAAATPERTAKLEWQTGSEKNSSHFIVERSADGLRFTDQVCRMQAAGTSNELLTYHNFDYKPLTGSNYYRLKMVDKDGSFKYSETRRLVFEAPLADVAAIPNPFQTATTIRVSADQAQMASYHVVDLAGRVIKSGVWEVAKGVQEFPMPLEDAAAGNYILTVQGSTILAEVRLTKSN